MGRKNIKALTGLAFLLAVFAVSCKDKTDCCTVPPPPASGERQVYVVCEGSMGNGNSALSLYLPAKDSTYEDVFRAVNQQSLGDVFQSMTLIGDSYFLCVNNSDQVVVIGKDDRKVKGRISIPKPRYVLPLSENKALVSTLFSDRIYTIDPKAMQVSGSFSIPAQNPEGMMLYSNRVFVCPWDTASQELFVIDPATYHIRQTIRLEGRAPQEATLDREGRLWVLSGNAVKGKRAYLTRLDPDNGQVLKTYVFPNGADALRLEWNNTKDTLYFIEVNYDGGTQHNGIFRMGIHQQELPAQPFIAAQAYQYFWALGVEPGTGNIYVGDPRGFIQKGIVYVYRPDGSKLTQFTTGVGPGHFYFSGY